MLPHGCPAEKRGWVLGTWGPGTKSHQNSPAVVATFSTAASPLCLSLSSCPCLSLTLQWIDSYCLPTCGQPQKIPKLFILQN